MGEGLPEPVSERLIELSEGMTTDKLVANRVRDEGANNSDWLDDKGFTELVTSAQAGFAPAQFDLAVMYDFGLYVEENAELAFDWYRKAAQQGLPEAQNAVAVMYDSGRGVARNTREALSWYELAVENGNQDARANLAEFRLSEKNKLAVEGEMLRRYRKRLSRRAKAIMCPIIG